MEKSNKKVKHSWNLLVLINITQMPVGEDLPINKTQNLSLMTTAILTFTFSRKSEETEHEPKRVIQHWGTVRTGNQLL